MLEQQLTLPGGEIPQWRRGGFLEPAVLKSLYDINRRWLELLASPMFDVETDIDRRTDSDRLTDADRRRIGDVSPGAFYSVAREVARVGPASRAAAARCPFALFGARFHDGECWARISGLYSVHDGMPRADTLPEGERRSALADFTQIAFFYGWHLVRLNPAAARLLLGISDPVAAILKELSPARLQQVAEAHPHILAPRWGERLAFWRMLLNAAQRGESHFAQARFLGLQMVPADLMPEAGEGRK